MTQDAIEFRNSSECFANAITTGFLATSTVGTNNDRWAGNWMYMYSKLGIDYFKNRDTRNYIEVPQKSMSESIHYATLFSHYTACGINISSYGGAFRRDVEESSKPDEVTCATCLSNRLVSESGFDLSYNG